MHRLPLIKSDIFIESQVGTVEQRQELINRLLKLKDTTPTENLMYASNYGCWRISNPITDCEWMNNAVYNLAVEAAKYYSDDENSKSEKFDSNSFINMNSWANINEPYSRNVYHAHKAAHFSCCFYLQADNTGDLVLTNPANILNDCNHSAPYVRDFIFKPKDGDLIIWPAWMPHEIEMNLSDKLRINIVFDITIKNNVH